MASTLPYCTHELHRGIHFVIMTFRLYTWITHILPCVTHILPMSDSYLTHESPTFDTWFAPISPWVIYIPPMNEFYFTHEWHTFHTFHTCMMYIPPYIRIIYPRINHLCILYMFRRTFCGDRSTPHDTVISQLILPDSDCFVIMWHWYKIKRKESIISTTNNCRPYLHFRNVLYIQYHTRFFF